MGSPMARALPSPEVLQEGATAADRAVDLATSRSHWELPIPDAAVHPMDYKVYALRQLGRNAATREIVEKAVLNSDRYYDGVIGYNFAAMPARFALEREAWEEAMNLRIPVDAAPHIEAITRFARTIGAARAERAWLVGPEIGARERLEASLRSQGEAYWATIVRAQRIAAASWRAHASGDAATALRLAEEAAALEEAVEKHPVTPGPHPARSCRRGNSRAISCSNWGDQRRPSRPTSERSSGSRTARGRCTVRHVLRSEPETRSAPAHITRRRPRSCLKRTLNARNPLRLARS